MNELRKVLVNLGCDYSGAVILVDEAEGVMEIAGAEGLKTACYEVSSFVLQRYHQLKKSMIVETEKPHGTKCWLPYLPPCGVLQMSSSQIDLYWNQVMRAVLSERGRHLGYETPKRPPNKPSWVPEECAWVSPAKRLESSQAAAMTSSQFLENQRLVLQLAYEAAGYDVDAHTSATDYLGKKRTSRNDPFLIPMVGRTGKSPGSIQQKTKNENRKPEPKQQKSEGTKCWLPFLPLCGINKMSFNQVSQYWSPVVRALLPKQNRSAPEKPSWVPAECAWAGLDCRMGGALSAAMTKSEFLVNQRLVLKAAYEHAGYDIEEHVSDLAHLNCDVSTAQRDGIQKSFKMDEGNIAAIILIDETNGIMEIDGAKILKMALLEVSSYIINRFHEQNNEMPSTSAMELPRGVKCRLPYLPPGGIDKMGSMEVLIVYWNQVMQAVMGSHKGYETPRNPVGQRPSWVPKDCPWVHPIKKLESASAAAMPAPEFRDKLRKVLRAAYEYAGYDVGTHISATHCLTALESNLGLTLRVPLSALQQYSPSTGSHSNLSSPAASSFSAAADSTAIPDINIPEYDRGVVEQLRRPPVVRLKNIGLVELVPRLKRSSDVDSKSLFVDDRNGVDNVDDDSCDGDDNVDEDSCDGESFSADHDYQHSAMEHFGEHVGREHEGDGSNSSMIKKEKPTKTCETTVVPASSSIHSTSSVKDCQGTEEEQQNDDFFLDQLQFFKETEQVIESGLHRREQMERDKNELAESRRIYQQNLEAMEAKIEAWTKFGEEVVYAIEEMMSDSKIDDAYRKMAKDWIESISKALKMATEAVETVQKQAEEMEEEERIWKETESRLTLSLKETAAERKRVEMYLKQIMEKEQQLLASAEAKSSGKWNGKRKRSKIDDG